MLLLLIHTHAMPSYSHACYAKLCPSDRILPHDESRWHPGRATFRYGLPEELHSEMVFQKSYIQRWPPRRAAFRQWQQLPGRQLSTSTYFTNGPNGPVENLLYVVCVRDPNLIVSNEVAGSIYDKCYHQIKHVKINLQCFHTPPYQ